MKQFERRLIHDEEEKMAFGHHIVRYTPVMVQNTVIEGLKQSLDADGLARLNSWVDELAEEHLKIPKEKHSLLHGLVAQKE